MVLAQDRLTEELQAQENHIETLKAYDNNSIKDDELDIILAELDKFHDGLNINNIEDFESYKQVNIQTYDFNDTKIFEKEFVLNTTNNLDYLMEFLDTNMDEAYLKSVDLSRIDQNNFNISLSLSKYTIDDMPYTGVTRVSNSDNSIDNKSLLSTIYGDNKSDTKDETDTASSEEKTTSNNKDKKQDPSISNKTNTNEEKINKPKTSPKKENNIEKKEEKTPQNTDNLNKEKSDYINQSVDNTTNDASSNEPSIKSDTEVKNILPIQTNNTRDVVNSGTVLKNTLDIYDYFWSYAGITSDTPDQNTLRNIANSINQYPELNKYFKRDRGELLLDLDSEFDFNKLPPIQFKECEDLTFDLLTSESDIIRIKFLTKNNLEMEYTVSSSGQTWQEASISLPDVPSWYPIELYEIKSINDQDFTIKNFIRYEK